MHPWDGVECVLNIKGDQDTLVSVLGHPFSRVRCNTEYRLVLVSTGAVTALEVRAIAAFLSELETQRGVSWWAQVISLRMSKSMPSSWTVFSMMHLAEPLFRRLI